MSIYPGIGQIPLNEPMHEDSLRAVDPMEQLKLRSHYVMNSPTVS